MELKILALKALAAAYEAALHYDYCPEPDEASELPNEIVTNFNEEEKCFTIDAWKTKNDNEE
jgi:hypothetical protein